jgi:hypothetical protein
MLEFDYKEELMPPIAHILRFWTSSAMVSIESTPDTTAYGGWNSDEYCVRIPSHGERSVGTISLDKDWPGRERGFGEFIFISVGFHTPGDMPEPPGQELLNLMLTEWLGNVAFRAQICRTISIDAWRLAKPVWKLITSA